jgi:small subunit ribosomal protein S7
MDIVEQKARCKKNLQLEIWKDALTNIMPHVEVRSRRVGGATFQIPMQIRPDRKISMAMKWMITYMQEEETKNQWLKN